jgi:hypothetical protein
MKESEQTSFHYDVMSLEQIKALPVAPRGKFSVEAFDTDDRSLGINPKACSGSLEFYKSWQDWGTRKASQNGRAEAHPRAI